MPFLHLLLAMVIGLLCALPAVAQEALEAIPQPEPRPMPSALLVEDDLRLEIYFAAIKQGGVGLLRLTGEAIDRADFSFLGEDQAFFHLDGDAWYALIRAGMDTQPRTTKLTVNVEREQRKTTFTRDLRVDSAGYILQEFAIPGDRAFLVDPEVEVSEFAKLDELTARITPESLWDAAGFSLPLDSEITSPFGAYRRLNETIETRHTGWDQRAAEGTPVRAMAAGQVVFADELDIRGNYVLIDHGYGIFSGYAHFSQLDVSVGQAVAAGQIIGASGNTGRSSGPHLHWELVLRGRWVDGLTLLETWLPT